MKCCKSHPSNINSVIHEIFNSSMLASIISTTLFLSSSEKGNAFPANFNVWDLNGQNGFSVTGKTQTDGAGLSVSRLGDLNGDGIDDFTLSAPWTDFNGSYQCGRTYVIFGNINGFPADVNVNTLTGSTGFAITGIANTYSGNSVSDTGDVNGDGIDDMIIGANKASGASFFEGETYVVFGRKTAFPSNIDVSALNGSDGFAIYGVQEYDYSGISVSGAGDVNGDGIGDIIIGSQDHPNPDFIGQCYVVLGSKNPFPAIFHLNSLTAFQGFSLTGIQPYDHCGRAVSGAGDVNGDGVEDIIIGATGATNGVGRGQAYVVFGKKQVDPNNPVFPINFNLLGLNGANGFIINGSTNGDNFGSSVGKAGDVNGDGIGDVIIGAVGFDAGVKDSGRAYVIYGSKQPFPAQISVNTINGNNGFTISGAFQNQNLGASVGGADDINNDGIDEVIVGAPSNPLAALPGRAYVVLGSKNPFPVDIPVLSLNGANGFSISGKSIKDYLGCSVKGAKDVNNDGVKDIVVGAYRADAQAMDCGQGYIIFGEQPIIGDVDGNNQADLILQLKSRVSAALMTNGYYTGVKKVLIYLDDLNEQVVAVNDFDLDGVTDLATQSGTLVRLRKGPVYGVASSFNLPSDYKIIASGNIRGKEVSITKGYPELIIVKSPTPPFGKDYYYSLNKGGWVFNAPQFLYTHNGNNPIVGAGRFIASNIQTNRYDEAIMYSFFANGTNKDLYAQQSSFTPNDKSKFLMTMYQDEVLGAGNFKTGSGTYEFIWSNSNKVYFTKWYSGYQLSGGEKVVGPK